jgi:hypothetical protein
MKRLVASMLSVISILVLRRFGRFHDRFLYGIEA